MMGEESTARRSTLTGVACCFELTKVKSTTFRLLGVAADKLKLVPELSKNGSQRMNALRNVLTVLSILLLVSIANGADSGTLLVLNKSDNTVSLIDLGNRKVVATIPTGVGPHEVAVSPNG